MPRHEFHNPYHFVPVKKGADAGPLRTRMDKSFEQLGWADSAARHDIYQANLYSGRVICQLTTRSPLLNGGAQEDGNYNRPRQVLGFRNGAGLAASSLRGMIGSVLEAASNSALRVLDEKPFYSFRQKAGEGLSAVGMFWDKGEKFQNEDRYRMILMTPPTMRMPKSAVKSGQRWKLEAPWARLLQKRGIAECGLRVYLGNGIEACRDMENDKLYRTFDNKNNPQVYGMKVPRQKFDGDGTLIPDGGLTRLHIKGLQGQAPNAPCFLIAQDAPANAADRRPRPWQTIPEAERTQYTPGLLRVLGCWGRDDIPETKKHELFLTLPPELGADAHGQFQTGAARMIPVPAHVVERFHAMADERNDDKERLPYEPRDTRRNTGGLEKNRLRLKRGDLVFFNVDPNGEFVTQISFSSIWRGQTGGTREFFAGMGDKEVLPMTPERERVTVGEQMLGFAEEIARDKDGKKQQTTRQGRALASRLRFSDGQLAAGQDDIWFRGGERVKLRVLDSPKPPCAAMYFKEAGGGGGAIKKAELRPGQHVPQGRKFYAHAWNDPARPEPFETRLSDETVRPGDAKADHASGGWTQFSEARLLRSGLTYHFDVRFDNLKKEELQLLIYSLSPGGEPGRAFWHKVGMGKPIGLGSVEVEPVGLFLVERQKRYSATGLEQPRYTRGWVKPVEDRSRWPGCYSQEAGARFENDETVSVARLRKGNRDSMDADIRAALETIGNPASVTRPVHVPASSAYEETETFAWFKAVEDEKAPRFADQPDHRQQLKPLHRNVEGLPVLLGWPAE